MNSDGVRSAERLAAALRKAAACGDEAWYRDIVRSDPRGGSLTPAETEMIVKGSIGAAEELAAPAVRRFGREAGKLAADLGLAIVSERLEPGLPPALGICLPEEKRIVLYADSITMVTSFLADVGLADLLEAEKLGDVVIFHELFHALEDGTPGIFTRSAMLARRVIGLVPYRRGYAGASEIGAVHFSKLMTGIGHSPRVFERCLLLAMHRISPEAAVPVA